MEANEGESKFIYRIKDLSDKLGDIGEVVESTDLVIISLKGLVLDYKVFISALAAREKPSTFEEIIGILIQEEERMKNYDLDSQGSDLALIARGRQPHRGKPWNKNKCKFHTQHKIMAQPDSYRSRSVECHYCGKQGHLARNCFQKMNRESNQGFRNHNGNFVHKETLHSHRFKNLSLFIYEAALFAATYDENAWFIDSGTSTHMSCKK